MIIDYIATAFLLAGVILVGRSKFIVGWSCSLVGTILFALWAILTINWSILITNCIFFLVTLSNLHIAIKNR